MGTLLVAATAAIAIALTGCGGGKKQDNAPAPGSAPAAAPAAAGVKDWTRFGYDAARTSHSPQGLTSSQVKRLREHRVRIDGTADNSPVYLARAQVGGHTRELLVLTTTYGRTLGLDPSTGAVLWRFTPSSYSHVAGSAQITTSTPVVDPNLRFLFAASPDGLIHKLRVSDGHEVTTGSWPASVTRDATHEKIASALNIHGSSVLVTTGGYIGDAPPYQGKVLAIDRSSGKVTGVFNSLCSNRREIIQPSSCPTSDSAIWGRAGAVVDSATNRIYVTSSNGPFNGLTDWSDSVLELSLAPSLLRHYTPPNEKVLAATDSDLGSTSPALLPDPSSSSSRAAYLLQGGKDRRLRLLSVGTSLHRVAGTAGRQLGGEVQSISVVGDSEMFTAPAVLHSKGLTEAFVATGGGTAAYRLAGGRLHEVWRNGNGGTSPVLAGGLLWVYDPAGALNVYRPGSGRLVRRLPAPPGHWNSPIVAGGRVYLPSGNANDHATSGTLSIYRVSG
ncbi:MAG: PQQ-binding-like beta-propeller repeat protein [Thermoleophilaceae bacterium]